MSARPPVADRGSWTALAICVAAMVGIACRWHRTAWVFGGIGVLLAGRALTVVLGARASMRDPEDALEKESRKE